MQGSAIYGLQVGSGPQSLCPCPPMPALGLSSGKQSQGHAHATSSCTLATTAFSIPPPPPRAPVVFSQLQCGHKFQSVRSCTEARRLKALSSFSPSPSPSPHPHLLVVVQKWPQHRRSFQSVPVQLPIS